MEATDAAAVDVRWREGTRITAREIVNEARFGRLADIKWLELMRKPPAALRLLSFGRDAHVLFVYPSGETYPDFRVAVFASRLRSTTEIWLQERLGEAMAKAAEVPISA